MSDNIYAALGRKAGSPKVLRRLLPYEKMVVWAADPRMLQSIQERFWNNVLRDESSSCWIWTACKQKRGYGRINICGDVWLASRIAYWLSRGSLNPEMEICHRCDNPPCVNPFHLFIGTHLDNMRDRYNKGLWIKGEQTQYSKLTASQVQQIRQSYIPRIVSQFKLAALFGGRVSPDDK